MDKDRTIEGNIVYEVPLKLLKKSDFQVWDPKDDRDVGKLFVECIEVVARREAERIGFDMEKERHALMRMIATVFSKKELRDEAIDLLKERWEYRDE